MYFSVMSTVIDDLVGKIRTNANTWLKKNYKQRFSFGHPADYIMPPIDYCLNAVSETMRQSGSTSVTDFVNSFKFCMTDIVSAISRTVGYITDELIPQYTKKPKEEAAVAR